MHHPRQDNTYHGLCYTSRGMPNVPKSVNLDSSCTVDDDFNSLPSEPASRNSSSTVIDDSLFTVNVVSKSGFSERLRKM